MTSLTERMVSVMGLRKINFCSMSGSPSIGHMLPDVMSIGITRPITAIYKANRLGFVCSNEVVLTLANISFEHTIEINSPMLKPWMPCRKIRIKISNKDPLLSNSKITNANMIVTNTWDTTAKKHVNMCPVRTSSGFTPATKALSWYPSLRSIIIWSDPITIGKTYKLNTINADTR